jgi:DNA-directed RNA polymerase subunit RPC12/RpoP
MSDSVQIHCTRCRSSFRERARRLQSGYSRQCPNCEVLIFFDESSNDKNVQAALQAARKLRRLLREAEDVKPEPKQAPTYVRTG